jgi:Notch-like protein
MASTVCSTHPGGLGDLSSEEVCDALDNDCNGVPDDAVPNDGGPCQVEGQLGECRAGVFRCRGVQGLVCGQVIFAAIEVCDSLDNDCDGEVDDNADDIGAACNVGVGACLRGGVTVCRDGGEVCSAVAGQPAAEICDGIDNNCDGNVDGDVVDDNEPCSAGLGPCRENGVEVCGGGELVCDAVARDGSPEICNGRDDDCNGQIDDDAAEVGDVCARGLGPCRRLGQKLCVNDGLECSVEAGQPGVETCNDIDDDCDGQVDNDAAEVGDLCVRGVGECERSGQKTCAGGELGCSAVVALPSNELCNGLDDDCNGVDDNDLTDDGGPCSEGLGVCLQAGTDQCVGGGLQCDAVAGQPIALACDGDDNDCDGQPDVLPDLTCGDGICANTVPACVDDEDNACEPLDVAVIEIPANELDDDCDGEVDEL